LAKVTLLWRFEVPFTAAPVLNQGLSFFTLKVAALNFFPSG
jgi:hypothetical protein